MQSMAIRQPTTSGATTQREISDRPIRQQRRLHLTGLGCTQAASQVTSRHSVVMALIRRRKQA